MKLYGKNWKRDELAAFVPDIAKVAGIRQLAETDGPASGGATASASPTRFRAAASPRTKLALRGGAGDARRERACAPS